MNAFYGLWRTLSPVKPMQCLCLPLENSAHNKVRLIRGFFVGDLATVFMLEDRVSARTNAGGDSNEFDPASSADSTTIATSIVGSVPPSNWTGNQTISNGMAALRVYSQFLWGLQWCLTFQRIDLTIYSAPYVRRACSQNICCALGENIHIQRLVVSWSLCNVCCR